MPTKFGAACKMMSETNDIEWYKQYNLRATTKTSLLALPYIKQVDKILDITKHNIEALTRQFSFISTWHPSLRMWRMGSDVLPMYTEPSIRKIYDEPTVKKTLETLDVVGEIVKLNDIRISFHPGQFTMLVSEPHVVSRAVQDLEYHAEIFRLMGISPTMHETEINIHLGRYCVDFKDIFLGNMKLLSEDTRQWLSIENDEFSYGIDDVLELKDHVKILLDVHHHWINDECYIDSNDTRLEKIISSWRGVKPELHFAISKEDLLNSVPDMPDIKQLLIDGHKKSKLRAHSHFAWNSKCIDYVLEFADHFDIMFEGKSKNLGQKQIYDQFVQKDNIT